MKKDRIPDRGLSSRFLRVAAVRVGSAWVIGALALYWAYSPPELLSEFYTAGIGLLSAGLFVPTIAGLWWRRANLTGGVLALVTGAATYVLALPQIGVLAFAPSPILVALPASAVAMAVGGALGPADPAERIDRVAGLHEGPSDPQP